MQFEIYFYVGCIVPSVDVTRIVSSTPVPRPLRLLHEGECNVDDQSKVCTLPGP